ncbi:hypothetical protein [Allonocardiopsis opalescens]|uniref:Uncharacterized protein n=1 Tax=Allonocardiopsis opalescens TaxID=1144618 RepID=A0A2T0PZ26_9ACTN|nr:hypothetical protein [Allonocardiopsis opalescens]PRX96770.1 hypothetical protein CLV72_107293 [Allonocardiopsis opalescens]
MTAPAAPAPGDGPAPPEPAPLLMVGTGADGADSSCGPDGCAIPADHPARAAAGTGE